MGRLAANPQPVQTVATSIVNKLDALVLGKGPAGLAVAAALCERGLGVGVLGPAGAVHWPAQYGAWLDELEPFGFPNLAERSWPETVVGFGPAGGQVLTRSYARVNKTALAAALLDQCERGKARWIVGEAAGVLHDRNGSTVRLRDGRDVSTRVVVDASGHRPALVRLPATDTQGFQTAVGWTLETGTHPFAPGQATLMDWDTRGMEPDELSTPSFLYAMPLGDGRIFVEETVLVSRPAVPFDALEARLQRRCAALGIPVHRIVEREQVWIPMGGGIPSARERVIGFGGAAGMVHPATGYMLPRVLEAAPILADAVYQGLEGGDPPRVVARAAWDAMWPAERRRRHALFRFGMETMLRLDAPRMQAFFATFFSLPDAQWQGYLGDRLSAPEVSRVMARLLASAPYRVRGTLVRSALSRPGARLAAALLTSRRAGGG